MRSTTPSLIFWSDQATIPPVTAVANRLLSTHQARARPTLTNSSTAADSRTRMQIELLD